MRISVRKPRLPKFTPRIGMSRPACAIASAMPSSVPSPPRTTTRSTSLGSSSRDRVVAGGLSSAAPVSVSKTGSMSALAQPRRELLEMLGGGEQPALGDDADAGDLCRS